MSYQTFCRVVFAVVIFPAALFVMPAKTSPLLGHAGAINDQSAAADSAQTFTTTPLKQVDSVDVELQPVWTPTQYIYLTPAPQPVSTTTVNTAGYFLQTATVKTWMVGLSMMAGGFAMICIPLVTKNPGSNDIGLTI